MFHTADETEDEPDEAEDKAVVAVSTEHKMEDGRDNVGQLLAGAEKAMADAILLEVVEAL